LQEGAAKKKLAKRNGVFVGAAHTRDLLKKVDQNLHTGFVRTKRRKNGALLDKTIKGWYNVL
jgi:hypothetical protein